MGRIDDALRRLHRPTGAAGGPPAESAGDNGAALDRFPLEHDDVTATRHGADALPPAPLIRVVPMAETGARASKTAAPPRPPAVAAPMAPAAAATVMAPEIEKLVDFAQLAEYAGFVARAVRRRKILVAAVFVLMASATAVGVWAWPKTYQVQTKLLAQRDEVMAALVNPGRTIPRDADAPIRAAAETVLRRENLLAIIKETDLVNDWEITRRPVMRLKDKAFNLIMGAPSEQERLDGLLGLLEKRLTVAAGIEGTVTITIEWPDPRMAYELASAALQSYLQARRVVETSAIADSIAILDRTADSLQEVVNRTITELESKQVRSPVPRPRPVVELPPPDVQPAAAQAAKQPSPEELVKLTRLKSAVDAKNEQVRRLEAVQGQQLQDANAKLSAASAIYTEGHPTIATLRQAVEALSRETPELRDLRGEARELEARYDAALSEPEEETIVAGASDPAPPAIARPRARVPQTALVEPISVASMGPDYVNPTSLRLRVQLTELATVRERANSARAELATSQASFKYRYSIVRPPQLPSGPIRPNVQAVLVAGLIGSLLMAVAAAVAIDLFNGRVVEAWQVQRQAGIPVVGTLGRM